MKYTEKKVKEQTMKKILLIALLAGIVLTGCVEKKAEPVKVEKTHDFSGHYIAVSANEISGRDPLNDRNFKIIVERQGNDYIFTVNHKGVEIGVIKGPYKDKTFNGRLEKARSGISIKTDPVEGLACEILSDDQRFHFIVYLKAVSEEEYAKDLNEDK